MGIKGELRRKALHFVAFMLVPVMTLASEHWYTVMILLVAFAVIVYPILWYLERKDFYEDIFQPRSSDRTLANIRSPGDRGCLSDLHPNLNVSGGRGC